MANKLSDLDASLNFFNLNFDQYITDLFECLKIPSVSTLTEYSNEITQCAEHLKHHMSFIGLKNVTQFDNYGNPILFGEYFVDDSKPTVLFYGHYDVQPIDPEDLWETPPFEPTIRNGYIYARGASDNKGMFYAQLKAVESYLKSSNTLPVNVKFLIEGEEEIGSSGLIQFIKDHKSLLDYDALLVSDSPMFSEFQPSVCTSLRGLIYLECHVKAMKYDVHSGQLGGGVPNVIHYVSDCIASMKDPITNRILVPGFYDNVHNFGNFNSKSLLAKNHLDMLSDFYSLGTHHKSNFYENTWFLPTLDCNGIQSGFVLNGAKTVVPSSAMFKLSCRLVSDQDPEQIFYLVRQYLLDFFPDSFEVEVNSVGPMAKPLMVKSDNHFIQMAIKALNQTHNMDVVIQGEGGSIPVLAELQSLYNKPTVLIGLNSQNDNIHAPNERFKVMHFRNGIESYIRYLSLI